MIERIKNGFVMVLAALGLLVLLVPLFVALLSVVVVVMLIAAVLGGTLYMVVRKWRAKA
jgi:hypothetical protein